MKKKLALALAAAMLVGLFAGCSSSGSGSSAGGSDASGSGDGSTSQTGDGSAAPASDLRVGVFYYNYADAYISTVRTAMDAELDALGVDVLIVGRGGGSIEDLWAFNEEEVARAVFECRTPVISAVGHETDTTIADFVADLRAPTPSAAAELAVFDYFAVKEQLRAHRRRMELLLRRNVEQARMRLANYRTKLSYVSPAGRLRENRSYAAELEEKLKDRMEKTILEKKHRLALLSGRLEGLSPARKLSQGYAWVSDETGKAVTDAADVTVGDTLSVHLWKGSLKAAVTEVYHE